jgi:hypothetical protein
MLSTIAISILQLLTAGRQIDVAICNQDGVAESVISSARRETELVFRAIGVQIVWQTCETSLTSELVVRLWESKVPKTVGPASLDVMGKAFVAGRYGGTVADVYLTAVRATAELHGANPSEVAGVVVAHEIGHLLLGPGHMPNGVMQAVWGQKEVDAVRQRRLRFSKEAARRIRLALGARKASERADDGRDARQ